MAKVAVSPAAWGQVLFERVLDDAADAGYHGVEASRSTLDASARELPRLRNLLAERRLTLVAAPFTGTYFERDERPAEIAALRRFTDILAEVNEDAIVVFRTTAHPARRDMIAGHPPLLPLSADRFARLADTLNEYCDRCRDVGLRGAVQNRVGSFIETPDEFYEVVTRTDPEIVGLAPDLGHWAYAGGDVPAFVVDQRPRIVYPRLKDVDQPVYQHVVAQRLGFRAFVELGGFKPLGEGSLPFDQALITLDDAGYTGWVCVELDPVPPGTPDPPDAKVAAQTSRDYLRTRLRW